MKKIILTSIFSIILGTNSFASFDEQESFMIRCTADCTLRQLNDCNIYTSFKIPELSAYSQPDCQRRMQLNCSVTGYRNGNFITCYGELSNERYSGN